MAHFPTSFPFKMSKKFILLLLFFVAQNSLAQNSNQNSIPKLIQDTNFNKNQKSIADAPIHSARNNSKFTKFKRDLNLIEYNQLSLGDFLQQVKGENLTIIASEQSAEAFEKLKEKAKLVTAINFFASSQTAFTEQNQALQIVRYTKTYAQNSQAGIMQTADFGLSTKLYYSLNHITYKGLNTSNYVNPSLAASNYQSIPTIELSLPLWQNREEIALFFI